MNSIRRSSHDEACFSSICRPPLAGSATLSSSCAEDNLSGIGESIQPNRDKVTGLATTITFDATTVATPTLYTDGTTSLLGTLIDETGSTVTGEFIKQIRTAEGVASRRLTTPS